MIPSRDPGELYFSTPARLAPLGIGVMTAALVARPGRSLARPTFARRRSGRSLATADIVIVAACLFASPLLVAGTWNSPWLFPGGLALFGLFASCLIALVAMQTTGLVAAVLRHRAMGYLGSRSYSLYLWHFPIAHLFASQSRPIRTALWVALSFGAAEVSYRWIEAPLRQCSEKPGPLSRLVPLVTVTGLFLVAVAVVIS